MHPQFVPSPLLSLLLLTLCLSLFRVVDASVTVYGNHGALTTATATGSSATYTGWQAYNPILLQAPPLPSPAPANTFNIQLANVVPVGSSIKLPGSFMGFSIEFSILDQVLGSNSTVIQVPFLNLMANIKDRAGSVYIRVGGNTQESASLVDSLPNNAILSKDGANTDNITKTPPVVFTEDLIYMMGNISSLVNVKWFMGIPFNDTSNWRLQIAEKGQQILGDYLVGLQVGNTPDLYPSHLERPSNYSPLNYSNEFGELVKAVQADNNIRNPNMLIGPNLAGVWTPEEVWNTSFAKTYNASLSALAFERYPTDNCFSRYGYGTYHDPQQEFANYTTHTNGQNIVNEYLGSQLYAQSLNKPLMMLETNSASCGGFPGISDAFGASLWAVDYAMQMAYSNFSVALFHVGGQNVSYNPFVPPPSTQTSYHQWTVGPVYYAALAMAESLGSSNTAQVIDLFPNNASEYTPAYGIYENGKIARVALFNYMTDSSGAHDYTATISVGGNGETNAMPSSVKVKYLQAASVAQKVNITWAGQTFGTYFTSDGRLQGTEDIQTVNCDTNANTCQIKVPAPSFALVFITNPSILDTYSSDAQQTFATSVYTRLQNTATVDPGVLATSNGSKGQQNLLGSTSKSKSVNAATSGRLIPSLVALFGLIFGAIMIGRTL